MPGIITRYLMLEVFKNSAATVLVLFVILMSNALGRVLADVADGEVPHQALWPVLLSQSINIFSILLPIGVFLGVIFAFGRLYTDHEIVVLNACGVGYLHFFKPVILVLIPVFMLSAYCSIWLNSEMQRYAQSIVNQENDLNEFERIRPGQFNESKSGGHVFFMESVSENNRQLNDIIVSQSGSEKMIMETAKTGRYQRDPDTGDLFLVIGPGSRFEGQAGDAANQVIEFAEHGILIEHRPPKKNSSVRSEIKSPDQLRKSKKRTDRAELHWRIAIPIVLLVLGLLAVPLSYIAPRQGRFGKVGIALLVYIIYLNLMAFTKAKLEDGDLPMTINFWWIHGLFLILMMALLYRRNRGLFFDSSSIKT
ncbi:MAG: lipopolysaccharide export system permease protein [Gammaproteobacteria bacterium]|jgi:lipopolysaccharide export system permease protein